MWYLFLSWLFFYFKNKTLLNQEVDLMRYKYNLHWLSEWRTDWLVNFFDVLVNKPVRTHTGRDAPQMVASCFKASSVNVPPAPPSNSCSGSRSPCRFDRSPVNTQDRRPTDPPWMLSFLTLASTEITKQPFKREAAAFYSYTTHRTWQVRLHNVRRLCHSSLSYRGGTQWSTNTLSH